MPMEILEDHMNAKSNQLSPRVESEMILNHSRSSLKRHLQKRL